MFTEKERALPLEDPNLPILFPDTVHLQWIFAGFINVFSKRSRLPAFLGQTASLSISENQQMHLKRTRIFLQQTSQGKYFKKHQWWCPSCHHLKQIMNTVSMNQLSQNLKFKKSSTMDRGFLLHTKNSFITTTTGSMFWLYNKKQCSMA